MLADGKLRKSYLPWKTLLLIVNKLDVSGKRTVFDYSTTTNKFALLDSYLLPKINSIIKDVAKFKVLSSLDLKSAYHQIPLCEKDKPYTPFQVGKRNLQMESVAIWHHERGAVISKRS